MSSEVQSNAMIAAAPGVVVVIDLSNIHKRISRSYGAMTTVLSFLTDKQTTCMQQLSRWWYHVNMPRIQIKVHVSSLKTYQKIYFVNKEQK